MSGNTFSFQLSGTSFCGEMPEECPLCHVTVHTGSPLTQVAADSDTIFQVVFCCPKCGNLFIAYYAPTKKVDLRFRSLETYTLKLKTLKPYRPNMQEVTQTIKEISPSFVSIYSEALDALEMGLRQICGPGFRKAFEYLIKDYAKQSATTGEQKKNIEQLAASAVVNNYVGDTRIKEIARRALWLGNDETHYLRKWTQHDIDDLVTLIRLTIHWIEMEILSSKYIADMPKDEKA